MIKSKSTSCNTPEKNHAPGAYDHIEKTYETRLRQRQDSLAEACSQDLMIARFRLIIFVLGAVAALVGPVSGLFSWHWGLLFLPPFIFLVLLHRRIIDRKCSAEQSVAFYSKGIERLNDDWGGKGTQRKEDAKKKHPYAVDIDLYGPHSLFERLCTARTDIGESTLSQWLAVPASIETIHQRQKAIGLLREELDFREDIYITSGGVKVDLQSQILKKWLANPSAFSHKWTWLFRIGGLSLTLFLISTAVLWRLTTIGPLPFAGAVILQLLVLFVLKKKIFATTTGIDRPERQLRTLASLLKKLETKEFSDPLLNSLREPIIGTNETASSAVAHLSKLVTWIESRNNMVFGPIWFALALTIHTSISVEKWRKKYGPKVMGWLETIGKWEALLSLTTYAYENPAYPFPSIASIEQSKSPMLKALELGHPLLPESVCVRNDVFLEETNPVWIVSGSNMSGKSTLLRAVGLNVVLAMAGGPVRAESMSLPSLQIGATIRIEDSLQAGSSRFFEEIKRLKQLMDLAKKEIPLLFLLDEILHGTNSHDRRQGAKAIISEFIKQGGIGLVTTHDLGVAGAAENQEALLKNVHFTDQVRDGELVFDYKLKPGIVKKSNALELMRVVGLKV